MPFISDEIASQPDAWRAAAATAARAIGMPEPGERVAVVGCGTSWFMAEAYAALREQGGFGETDAFAASQFPHTRQYDRLVVISRSGTTTEILQLLERHGERCPTVALTSSAATPVVDLVRFPVEIAFAHEQSVVQTLFASTALALLRASLGETLGALADAADAVLTEPLAAEWISAEQITFL
ncbi:MAG: sugar isomerase, partial [Actinobacteria bacterium]|nr:sugar isomerase [Actinomycetota bacterium]